MEKTKWEHARVKPREIEKYIDNGKDFIPNAEIEEKIRPQKEPDQKRVKDILAKSMSIETLSEDELAALLNVTDEKSWDEMKRVALKIKHKVYDNRVVTFAPLYMGNKCVNNCLYCAFRKDNDSAKRRVLTIKEVEKETEILAGKIGHKRLIVVYGEHPETDADYIARTLKAIYGVKVRTKNAWGQIRRANVNAAPLRVKELKKLREVGIGTYQVFQETYHKKTYEKVHPAGTLKANYAWRLYCMHRSMEAGVDDVGLGVLFGLSDWRFEVMGLLYHARELKKKFGVGPHTISFPRLEAAENTPFTSASKYKVNDEDFKKIVTLIRLAVPHTGMILTARERPEIRKEVISLGCTQFDASTRIGIGAYSDRYSEQEGKRQQFLLGDTRSLDEIVREQASEGRITSFCTAGYRCGRTGECIMDLLKTGQEGKFCKLNAILTFREWLDDFASEETRIVGEKVIEKEIDQIKEEDWPIYPQLMEYYERIKNGERDLYF
ncbi:MAG: [FeFe] hydrogenase H-cluster radical SAM maturase HydG [Candidatus Omnitrophica bacterium]|nr:[FeFe] hydrogenase H-cluster radical SAM maturase HydG [Candidatus Omnitrophota bacterium]